MNWFSVRAVFLLFLSSIALIRRAQNEFYENDLQNPLRGLFPFEGGPVANLKDSFDDVSSDTRLAFNGLSIYITVYFGSTL